MNKQELIDAIAAKADISKAAAGKAIDALIETVTDAVAANDSVRLVGFGTFESSVRKEKIGRNPKTKQPMTIPASRVPKFSVGATFKNKVKSAA